MAKERRGKGKRTFAKLMHPIKSVAAMKGSFFAFRPARKTRNQFCSTGRKKNRQRTSHDRLHEIRSKPPLIQRARNEVHKRLGFDRPFLLHRVEVDPLSELVPDRDRVRGETGEADVGLFGRGEDLRR